MNPRLKASRDFTLLFASTRLFREVAAVVWLALISAFFLAPALVHGHSLGPYDILSQFGLTNNPHVNVHNLINSDEIQEFIPWQALAWIQVHAGYLPLWNPHSLLGLPLAFDFQSTPFSPTVAVGYLFPLSLAHDATVVSRLIFAGTGAYFLARVLRLSIIPALVCATIFELSGGLTVWLGDYPAGFMTWAGWVLAASALVLRGRHRVASICFLALTLAFAFLEGEPQIAAVLIGVVTVFAGVMTYYQWRSGERHAAWASALDHGLGLVAAMALVAPIYLPGIQLGLTSSRHTGPPVSGLPLYDLTHLLFSSYNGFPTSMSTIIGPDNLYVSMIYVGTIALVLALTSLAWWRRRREVVAFTISTVILLSILFFSPLLLLFRRVPGLDVFRLQLATTALDLCLAVLAGFGVQALLAARGQRLVEWWFRAGVALVGVTLTTLGVILAFNVSHLPTSEWSLRRGSFAWPTLGLVVVAVVLMTRWRSGRDSRATTPRLASRRRIILQRIGLLEIWAMLLVETVFLISAGSGLVSSSTGFLPVNNAITTLQRVVGTSLVGFGSCAPNAFPSTGLVPDINLAYQVSEFAAYDPIIPRSYHVSYGAAAGTSTQILRPVGLFCPQITSVTLARLYGIGFVLEPPGLPGPAGTRLVATLEGEGLYAVPDSGRATLVPLDGTGPSVVQPSSEPTPTTWRIDVNAARASHLELRVTDVPGWRAEIDGRPLKLTSFHAVMLQADVPAGHYVVTLRYWPTAFSVGLVFAGVAALTLLLALVVVGLNAGRRRRSRNQGSPSPRGMTAQAPPQRPAPVAVEPDHGGGLELGVRADDR